MRQVGRTTDQFRQQRAEGVERHLRSLARSDHRAIGLQPGDVGLGGVGEILGQFAVRAAHQLGGQLRVGLGVGVETPVPLFLAHQAAVAGAPAVADFSGNFKGRMRPAQGFAGGGHFVLAQRRTVA